MIKEAFLSEIQQHRRIGISGKIDGRLVIASGLEIIDHSPGGIHFTDTKRVLTNSACINLHHKGKMINMEFTNLPEAKLTIPGQIIESVDT